MRNEEQMPFVSCIMPTYNRRAFVPNAITYFLRQDYPNKELIIIDDGSDPVYDLVPDDPSIKYFRLEEKITLGAKLNLACTYAKGSIIANWDDDDWYADWRLTYQVNSLKQAGTDVCGINKLLYYDLLNKTAFQYIYPANQRIWLLGSSLCFTNELWKMNRFADIDVGMDGLFVRNTPANRVTVLEDNSFSVYMIHKSNISPKKTSGSWWHGYAVDEIEKLMGADWELYNNNGNGHLRKINGNGSQSEHVITQPQKSLASFKNIYACLVHEKEDCVFDLVRNLHYNDPTSTILIYNGGADPDLIRKDFPFDKFGAVVHPHPNPVRHGYLHNFALESMQFALDNFSFDAFTIVDSDQLSIRKDYSSYLADYFSSLSNVGILSSNPERVTRENRANFVAMQAYKEYELWKPFISSFPKGEEKFVHWTFWPSSVFSFDAVRDLVNIFKENKQLQEIMQHSKIWATEEVILPTVVSLLGYKIAGNPCSYNYVRYRKMIGHEDVKQALQKKEAYWVHPVERKYDNAVRKFIREQCGEYIENKNDTELTAANHFVSSALVTSIRKIQGWLSDKEAGLLIATTLEAGSTLKAPLNIVEIGSYHGKSTILFGTIIRELFPGSRVYAIDRHDGKLGAEDQGLKSFPPSFEMFKRNIENAGISGCVEIIKGNSFDVKWELPISLLFIDGLHDYMNVSKDFGHFSDWLVPGGFVAFHDYADYFPGVKVFVNALLETGTFRKINLVGSLMVVQKI